MENKNYTHNQNLPSTSNISNSDTTTTLSSLQTLQVVPATRSIDAYSDNNNRSNIIITQPTFNKLLSETIKQEQFEDNSTQEQYSAINRSNTYNIQQPTSVTSVHLNPRETINGLSTVPMSMTNIDGHLIPTLNPPHLANGAGAYYVSGDLTSNYKLPPSSNSDLPSPSTSSNSSNPPSSNHNHQGKRHGEGGDPTRKREIRLKKNREAARECRRKKKEYIKCLEERVAGLENQNKALIEELRHLKELYCRREDTDTNTNNKTTTRLN